MKPFMTSAFDRFVSSAYEVTLLSPNNNKKIVALYTNWQNLVSSYKIKKCIAGEKQDTNTIIQEAKKLQNSAVKMKRDIEKLQGWSYTKEQLTSELNSAIKSTESEIEKMYQ